MHQRGARVLVPQVGEATGEVDATLGQRVGRGRDARQVRVEALVDGIDAPQVMDDALVDRQGRGDHGTVAQHHEVGAAQRPIGTQRAPVGVGEPVLGEGERGGRTGIDLGGHRGEEDVALERRQPEPVDHRAQRAGMAERLLRVALHRVGVHCRRSASVSAPSNRRTRSRWASSTDSCHGDSASNAALGHRTGAVMSHLTT